MRRYIIQIFMVAYVSEELILNIKNASDPIEAKSV